YVLLLFFSGRGLFFVGVSCAATAPALSGMPFQKKCKSVLSCGLSSCEARLTLSPHGQISSQIVGDAVARPSRIFCRCFDRENHRGCCCSESHDPPPPDARETEIIACAPTLKGREKHPRCPTVSLKFNVCPPSNHPRAYAEQTMTDTAGFQDKFRDNQDKRESG
ncbi:unnamed protein product, partial [Scytosiphon promiscuus]